MILNIPTALTIIRIVFIPLIVFFYVYQGGLYRDLSAYIFFLAIVTDYFDGFIARRFNQTTSFGEFLDPIADKLLIVITIILLGRELESIFFLVSSLIIVSREFLVNPCPNSNIGECKSNISIKVNALGKIKTGFQMISLFLLLHSNIVNSYINLHIIGLLLLFIAAILTVVSFIYYVRNAWSDIIE